MTAPPSLRDPYLDPNTGVLRNLLGARTNTELAQHEANLTAAALYRLDLTPVPGHYDLQHLQAIHTAIFGDIYHWAGTTRTVGLAKGDAFCPPHLIHTAAEQIFGNLAAENHLRDLDPEQFTARTSTYYAAVNQLHPFREGNGRTQRAFFTQLARDAGYEICWERLDPDINIDACRQTLYGDPEPLRLVLADLIDPHQPVHGTPTTTAQRLNQRADHARDAAHTLYQRAYQWAELGAPGPNQQHITAFRAEHNRTTKAIQDARTASENYQAATTHLDQLEDQQRHLLTQLATTTSNGHPTIRGHTRTELQHQLQDLTNRLHTARQHATDQAAHAGRTRAAAPPPDQWTTHENHNRDLNTNWHHHLAGARDIDHTLAASQCVLADWLTHRADQLNELATAVLAGQVSPAQTGVAAGAILPEAMPAVPTPEVAAQPAPRL
jgi:cell filamentation protein